MSTARADVVLDTLLSYCQEQEEALAGQLDRYSQGKVDALRSVMLVITQTRTVDNESHSRIRSAAQR